MRPHVERAGRTNENSSSLVSPVKVKVGPGGVSATGRVLVDNPQRTASHNILVTARREVPTRPLRGPSEFSGNSTGKYTQPLLDRMGLRRRPTQITYEPADRGDFSEYSGSYSITVRGRIENILKREAEKLD